MKDLILNYVCDLVSDFLYYGRKEDEDLQLGDIEKAILKHEITLNDIVKQFETSLYHKINLEEYKED